MGPVQFTGSSSNQLSWNFRHSLKWKSRVELMNMRKESCKQKFMKWVAHLRWWWMGELTNGYDSPTAEMLLTTKLCAKSRSIWFRRMLLSSRMKRVMDLNKSKCLNSISADHSFIKFYLIYKRSDSRCSIERPIGRKYFKISSSSVGTFSSILNGGALGVSHRMGFWKENQISFSCQCLMKDLFANSLGGFDGHPVECQWLEEFEASVRNSHHNKHPARESALPTPSCWPEFSKLALISN